MIKPPQNICPEKYCFFWHEDKCDEAFKALGDEDCIRRPQHTTPAVDYYEPCDPELRRDGLPDDYFIFCGDELD